MTKAKENSGRLSLTDRYRLNKTLDEMKTKGQLPIKKTAAQAAVMLGRELGIHVTQWNLRTAAEALGVRMSDIVYTPDGPAKMPLEHVWNHIRDLQDRVTELENMATGDNGKMR